MQRSYEEKRMIDYNDRRAGMRRSYFLTPGSFLQISPGESLSFLISGSGNYLAPLGDLLFRTIATTNDNARLPVLVLHNGDMELRDTVYDVWNQLAQSPCGDRPAGPLYLCDENYPLFEPFLGMQCEDVIVCFEELLKRAGYTLDPGFPSVVRSHLRILDHIQDRYEGRNYTLVDLSYLCSFEDLELFHDNINALNCSETEKTRIWSDLRVAQDPSQLEIFRNLVRRLANEARSCGWSEDRAVRPDLSQMGQTSLRTAIEQNATLCVSLNDACMDLMRTYLTQELKTLSNRRFLLILAGITMKGSELSDVLCSSRQISFGLVCENFAQATGNDEHILNNLAERIHKYILYHHRTDPAALAVAQLIGTYQEIKYTKTQSTGRGFLDLFPKHEARGSGYSNETELRVKPERLQQLEPGRAILFDADCNELRYV